MKKRLRKVGNSVSLSLPSDMLKHMNVGEGDEVVVEYDIHKKEIKIRNANSTLQSDTLIDTIRNEIESVLNKRGL